MKKHLGILGLIWGFSVAWAAVEGQYTVVGTNPNGTQYRGTLVISKGTSTYDLRWQVGQSSYRGTGILANDILSVGWLAGKTCGVVSYSVKQNRLDGVWAGCGAKDVGTEIATKR
ncbi:MAG: hypothetical protein U0Z75_05205 [Deinococcaceae bacterium]